MANGPCDFHSFEVKGQAPAYPDNLTESEIFGDLAVAVIVQDNVDEVKKILLSANISERFRVEYLGILLHYVHSLEIAKVLLACGAYVNVKNFHGDTPLETAILNERIDLVKELLKYTALIDISSAANNPLIRATQMKEKCSLKVVEELLKHSACVHATSIEGETPLHLAVENNQCIEIITLLLEHGASIRAVDNTNQTPLHIAAKSPKSLEVIDILLQSGAEVRVVDHFHQTPLHHAVKWHRNVEVVKLLLNHGACPNARDHKGRTPLHLAAGHGDLMIIRELLNHHALINHVDDQGEMPLHYAVSKCENLYIIRELIERGAIVPVHDRAGETLLHRAVRNHKNSEVISELLKHGVCINGVNLLKETPLHHAVRENVSVGIVQQLLKSGAFVHACDHEGQTPLHLAARKMNLKIVKALVNYKADVCRTDKAGATPLSYAVRNEKRGAIVRFELLMREACANYNLPSDISTLYYSQLKIVEQLLKHGTRGKQTLEQYYELLDFVVATQDIPCAKLLIKYSLIRTFYDQEKIHLNRYEDSEMHDILSCHLKKCMGEIDQMKTLKINPFLSLYDFVTGRMINVFFYSKERIKIITEKDRLANNFPIYYDVIFPKIQSALARASLLDKVSKFQLCAKQRSNECLKNREIVLDAAPIKFILYEFLSNSDLRNLIEAFSGRNRDNYDCISWLFV